MIKLIAEIGWNHMGNMDLAESMISAAATAGADIAKFQTWNVDRLKPGPWDSDGRREIYQQAELSKNDHWTLKKMCDKYNIQFLTSCFSETDLEFIRELTGEVKIPSIECFNKDLVLKALSLFETLYISTGATKFEEYKQWSQYDNVVLLHCVSCYPCGAAKVNLPRLGLIKSLTSRFGYSGHYPGILDALAAASHGATVIEKHFTTDNNLPGRDNKFALLPDQFAEMRKSVDLINEMNSDQGCDFQQEETEARTVYAGRWDVK